MCECDPLTLPFSDPLCIVSKCYSKTSCVQYHSHHSAVTHLDFKMVAIKMQAQKRTMLDNANTALVSRYCPNSMSLSSGPPRGLGGPRANAKSGAPQNGLCEGGLGARPQEILRFYTL